MAPTTYGMTEVKKTTFAFEYTLEHCSDRVIPFWAVSTKKFKKNQQNYAAAAILVCAVKCSAGESGKFTVEGQQYKVKLLRVNKHLLNSSIENWQNIQDYAGPNSFKAKAEKSECGVSAASWIKSAKEKLGSDDQHIYLEDLVKKEVFRSMLPGPTSEEQSASPAAASNNVPSDNEDAAAVPPAVDNGAGSPAAEHVNVTRAIVNSANDAECVEAHTKYMLRVEKMFEKENTPEDERDILRAQASSLFPEYEESNTEYGERMKNMLDLIEDARWKNRYYFIQKQLWKMAIGQDSDNVSHASMRTTVSVVVENQQAQDNQSNAADTPIAPPDVDQEVVPPGSNGAGGEPIVELSAEASVGEGGDVVDSSGASAEEIADVQTPAEDASVEEMSAGGPADHPSTSVEGPEEADEQISEEAKFFKKALKDAKQETAKAIKRMHEAEENVIRRDQELEQVQQESFEKVKNLENENKKLSTEVSEAMKNRSDENKKLAKTVTDNVNEKTNKMLKKLEELVTPINAALSTVQQDIRQLKEETVQVKREAEQRKKETTEWVGKKIGEHEVKTVREQRIALEAVRKDASKHADEAAKLVRTDLLKAIDAVQKDAPKHAEEAIRLLRTELRTAKSDLEREQRNEKSKTDKLRQEFDKTNEATTRIEGQVAQMELGHAPADTVEIDRRLTDIERKIKDLEQKPSAAQEQAQDQDQPLVSAETVNKLLRRIEWLEDNQNQPEAGQQGYGKKGGGKYSSYGGKDNVWHENRREEDPQEIVHKAPIAPDGSRSIMLLSGRGSGFTRKQVQYLDDDQISLHTSEIDEPSDPMYNINKEWSAISRADRLRMRNERIYETRKSVRRMQDKLCPDQWNPVSPERRPELAYDFRNVSALPFTVAPMLKTEADLEGFEIWNRAQCVEARKQRMQGQNEEQVLKALQAKAVCENGKNATRQQETLMQKTFTGRGQTKKFLAELGQQYKALKDKAVRSLEERVGQAHAFTNETKKQAYKRFTSLLTQAKDSGATWTASQESAHLKRFLAPIDPAKAIEVQAKSIANTAKRDKPTCSDWEQAIEIYFGDEEEDFPDAHWQDKEAEQWRKHQKVQKALLDNAAQGGSAVQLVQSLAENDEEVANFVGGTQQKPGSYNRFQRGRSPGQNNSREDNGGTRRWEFHRRNSRGYSVNQTGDREYEPKYDQRGKDYESPRRYPTPRGTGYQRVVRDGDKRILKRFDRRNAKDSYSSEFSPRVRYDGSGNWVGENKARELRRNGVFQPWKDWSDKRQGSRHSATSSNRPYSNGSQRGREGNFRSSSGQGNRNFRSNSGQGNRNFRSSDGSRDRGNSNSKDNRPPQNDKSRDRGGGNARGNNRGRSQSNE